MSSIQDNKVVFYFNGKHRKTRKIESAPLRREMQSLIDQLIEYAKVGREPVALMERANKLPDAHYENLAAIGLLPPRAHEYTIDDVIEAYVKRKASEVGEKAIESRRAAGKVLTDFYGLNVPLKNAKPTDCDDLYEFIISKYAPTTTCQIIARIHGIGTLAQNLGWIPANPWLELSGGNKTNPDVKKYIDAEAVKEIMGKVDLTTAALIGLQRFAGARGSSELYNMTWDDIQWSVGTTPAMVKIKYAKTAKNHAKSDGAKYRLVPIPQYLEDILRRLQAERGDAETVLGIPKKMNQKKVRKAFREAGVDLGRPYNLRLSAVTDFRRDDLSIDEYARIADHSLQTAGRHYVAKESDDLQKETAKKIAANRETVAEQAKRYQNGLQRVKDKLTAVIRNQRREAFREGTKTGTTLGLIKAASVLLNVGKHGENADLQGSGDLCENPVTRGAEGKQMEGRARNLPLRLAAGAGNLARKRDGRWPPRTRVEGRRVNRVDDAC